MAEDWSPEEVAATVADYFMMLECELRGEAYNKKEHNGRLRAILNRRSAGAIEFKHANISAVLIEHGFPYIDGYKPRANYQELLKSEVVSRLEGSPSIARAADAVVLAEMVEVPLLRALSDIIVDPPVRDRDRAFERRVAPAPPLREVNYLEREARNASLGCAGELFVLEVERRRLWEAGQKRLSDLVDHVAATKGDGLGYDVLSFEKNGRERLIEVKTTAFGQMTPFFATKKEVRVSEEHPENFALYRLFKFRDTPKLFVLSGSLRENCVLDPVQYRASLP